VRVVAFSLRRVCVCGEWRCAACVRVRFDAVYENEMMQALDGVKVELC
jgi:hypothetical protein